MTVRTKLTPIKWANAIAAMAICANACSTSPDQMLALSDRIETESASLRSSQQGNSGFVQRVDAPTSWTIILVPRRGFDDAVGAKAGVREELRQKLSRRVPEWKGAAVIVYSAPQETSITKLPDNTDVSELAVVKGESGSTEIAIGLSRDADLVLVSSISVRPPQ